MKKHISSLNKNLSAIDQHRCIIGKLNAFEKKDIDLGAKISLSKGEGSFLFSELKASTFHIVKDFLMSESQKAYDLRLTRVLIDTDFLSKESKIITISEDGSTISSFFDNSSIDVNDFLIKNSEMKEVLLNTQLFLDSYANYKTSNKFSFLFILEDFSAILIKRSSVFYALCILPSK